MTLDDIQHTIEDYVIAARNALAAGFDGIEVHASMTYLLSEFLNSELNIRTDEYGGSVENRARIVLQILEALIGVWGVGRVGIKIAPAVQMGGFNATTETVPTFDYLVSRLDELALSHLQVVRAPESAIGTPVDALKDTVAYYRARYSGTLIANFGLNGCSGNQLIESGEADLVSFGASFIGNPDLVERMKNGVNISGSRREQYYQGGAEGYIDYPVSD
jgi:N-ethylmaleimide reductase